MEIDSILYPPIEPNHTGYLKVSPVHELYYEESGSPKGKPVVFLHGGPGGGTSEKHRRYFNPKKYRIILFDQRGAGKSRPHASLEENTTWHLVDDIEKIRKHLGISRWQVFGGSWGSTLAIAYAETHPTAVTELLLRGIFMLRQRELDWMYQLGADMIFPDAWEDYLKPIPENERSNMTAAYYDRLRSKDEKIQMEAAKAWTLWEGKISKLLPDADFLKQYSDERFAIAFARIECHYFMNKGFLKYDDQLLRDVEKIRKIPGVIVQGRYDITCPTRTAWDLHRAWPEAELVIVPDAGHSVSEPGISKALVAATDKYSNG